VSSMLLPQQALAADGTSFVARLGIESQCASR
jgi:hypothetical protein